MIAAWLRRLGLEAATVRGGVNAALRAPAVASANLPSVARVEPHQLKNWLQEHSPQLIDLQTSTAFRQQHAVGARWAVRPRLPLDAKSHGEKTVLLLSPDEATAQLAAIDLREAGAANIHWALTTDWSEAGLPSEATPDSPSDAEAIDYLLFVHDRHDGNLDAARRYLAWETGLIAQCEADELAVFRLPTTTQHAASTTSTTDGQAAHIHS